MEFLADDLLEGRNSASRGEKIASLYIAKELRKYGLEPFGENGTFFQDFELRTTQLSEETALSILDGSAEHLFNYGEHFWLSKRGGFDSTYSITESKLFFCGYGITDSSLNYDDYAGMDVSNSFVILFDDLPEDDSIFNSEEHRTYATWNYKRKNAEEKGAAGILILPTESLRNYWERYSRWSLVKSYALFDEEKPKQPAPIPAAAVSDDMAGLIFENELLSYDSLMSFFGKSDIPGSFTLDKRISFNLRSSEVILPSRNVIGLLPGNDEDVQNEIVTLGAHYDHVGVDGEEIYNGADDNASGVVTLLETARILSEVKENGRPVLFLFYSGEEKGLLGSRYLTNNVDWIGNVMVNINADMVGRGNTDSIFCIGSDKLSSGLKEAVEEVNEEGNYFKLDFKFDDPNDPNRFYWRSDHVHFVRRNIPSVFYFDNMKEDYHKPTDTAEKINYRKLTKLSRYLSELSLYLSDLDEKLEVDMLDQPEAGS
jgi:hypothetical protein